MKLKLRRWQSECIDKALHQYQAGQEHFLCLATPGAGKTTMASVLADRLLEAELADIVVCFAPSVVVAEDFQQELTLRTGKRFDGLLGSHGNALTYQAMLSLPSDFWSLLDQYRVFVIFDEIHHCSGLCSATANAWGERIITHIQGRAAYTLALTGTPWRSDTVPIALARYCTDTGAIHCDFQYGIARAIREGVCRHPEIALIDNKKVGVVTDTGIDHYNSIAQLLSDTDTSYQMLLENDALVSYTLRCANRRLDKVRKTSPNAGGLVVAASVAHAGYLAGKIFAITGEYPVVATYCEDNPSLIIQSFKHAASKWIISVGMISEGTNIPRLRVCCHLTRVKTELYFRQVLGRILRATGQTGEKAFMYMPAEPNLIDYATRLSEDIPQGTSIRHLSMLSEMTSGESTTLLPQKSGIIAEESDKLKKLEILVGLENDISMMSSQPDLEKHYQSSALEFFGRFRQELLVLSS